MLSSYDYSKALELYKQDVPFYALLGAAFLRADTENFNKLTEAFPDVELQLDQLYNTPIDEGE